MLKPGDRIPAFELPNQDDEIIRMQDYLGRKVVLFSFPRAGTPYCTKQACAYRDFYNQFMEVGAVILGITSNRSDVLRIWRKDHNLPFDLLSDTSHHVLKQLGIWGQDIIGLVQIPAARRSYWHIDEDGFILDMKIGTYPEEGLQKALDFILEPDYKEPLA